MTNKQWPEIIEGRIYTKNKTGSMFVEINGASVQFIQDVKKLKGKIIDIGCAYGVVTLPVLEESQCEVVAFDLSQEHLDILRNSVSESDIKKLTTIQGRFPDDFNFPDNTFDAIHVSHVFHFLNGDDTEKALTKVFKTLKPNGKIYLNIASVYFFPFKEFLPIYEKRAAEGAKWPGEMKDLKQYIEQDIDIAPESFYVYKLEDFEKLLQRFKFTIDEIFYYDLKEPKWFESGGKGCIGVIASKP